MLRSNPNQLPTKTPMVFASKTDASWSMSSAVAPSKNGVLADTEVVSAVVTTQRLLPLVPLATVLPQVLEASAAAGADLALAAVDSEAGSEAEEEEIGADSEADLAEATEVGMVVADLESATATASQRAPHPVLVVLEAAALAAAVTAATQEAVTVVATAILAEAHDTAIDRHATATAVAVAIASPSEVETVVATATVIGNATTTANAPTMAKVATTNRASKEGTERFLGLLHTPILHASGRFVLPHP